MTEIRTTRWRRLIRRRRPLTSSEPASRNLDAIAALQDGVLGLALPHAHQIDEKKLPLSVPRARDPGAPRRGEVREPAGHRAGPECGEALVHGIDAGVLHFPQHVDLAAVLLH